MLALEPLLPKEGDKNDYYVMKKYWFSRNLFDQLSIQMFHDTL